MRLSVLLTLAVLLWGTASVRIGHSQFVNNQDAPDRVLRRTLDSTAQRFFGLWANEWRNSQTGSLPKEISKGQNRAIQMASGLRNIYLHCHRSDLKGSNESGMHLTPQYTAIRSAGTPFSVCPTWRLHAEPAFPDEDGDIDAALLPNARKRIALQREKVLESLEENLRKTPDDGFLVSQHIRFLLDQRLTDSAYAVSKSCQADRWWCTTLQAFVEFRMGNRTRAESTFMRARAEMEPTERCEWDDVFLLTPVELRKIVDRGECFSRDTQMRRYWWLSDPMWSVPGNDRFIDHYVRTAEIRIRMGFAFDGRMRWSFNSGGDALRQMLTRYGWPTYLAWGGPGQDVSHSSWIKNNFGDPQAPYTTYEYSRDRVHTAPEWSLLENPFAATDSSWELNRPRDFSWRRQWFPFEFMRRTSPLLQLPRGQTALLRRHRDIIVAHATDIAHTDSIPLRDGAAVHFLATTAPDSILLLETSTFARGVTTFNRGRITPFPVLLGLEIRDAVKRSSADVITADSVVAEARTRFSIVPPATLQEMRAGEIAISEAVLLKTDGTGAPSPAKSDSLLAQMLGSTSINIRTAPKVGVYWETYGVNARDSVAIGIRLERRVNVGGVRRLGMALGLAGNPNAAIDITWREPEIGRVTSTSDGGGIAIQGRTVVLDLSRLEPGPYDVVMSVARVRGTPVTSVKRINITR